MKILKNLALAIFSTSFALAQQYAGEATVDFSTTTVNSLLNSGQVFMIVLIIIAFFYFVFRKSKNKK